MISRPSRCVTVRVSCEKTSSIRNPVWVRKIAGKRVETVKDIVSRLYMIGTSEVRQLSEIITELDDVHKAAVKEVFPDVKFPGDKKSTATHVEVESIFEP